MIESTPITPREWRRVNVWAIAFMVLTTLPYIVGWLSQGDEWLFSGFLFGADDGYSYLAKMRLGARGEWLFTLRYTAEPHDGALVFLPYLLLGKLTALVVAPDTTRFVTALAITFHLARIAAGVLLIRVSYRFTAIFLRTSLLRVLALVLIVAGGGLGWLLSLAGRGDLFGSLPVDFYVPEGYSFLILFGLPHLALARASLLGGFLLLFRALETDSPPRQWSRWSALAGVAWLVMGLCVPFYVAVLYLLLGCWGLAAWIRDRRFPQALFWRAINAALIPAPYLLYTAIVFLTNDVMGQWSAQNRLPSPHPLHYVFGYGVLAIPALWGIRRMWRYSHTHHSLPHLLLVTWVIIAPFIVYAPINVQRRLLEGAFVPLCILAVAGLALTAHGHPSFRRARALLLLLVLPTAALLWLGAMFEALTPDRPLFFPVAEQHAMHALNAYAPQDAIVLSLKDTGNVLPAMTDLKAYVGHGPETIRATEKEALAERFFAGTLDDDAQAALLRDVDYIYFGPLEQALGTGQPPPWAESLRPALDPARTAPVIVYEVPHE